MFFIANAHFRKVWVSLSALLRHRLDGHSEYVVDLIDQSSVFAKFEEDMSIGNHASLCTPRVVAPWCPLFESRLRLSSNVFLVVKFNGSSPRGTTSTQEVRHLQEGLSSTGN